MFCLELRLKGVTPVVTLAGSSSSTMDFIGCGEKVQKLDLNQVLVFNGTLN